MKIVTLMEDTCAREDLTAEHGLSLYIETDAHRLLLDTGASPLTWQNALKLGVDIRSVDTVVISHGHYDHTGGLLKLAEVNPKAEIYMRENAGGRFFHAERYIGIDEKIMELERLHLVSGDLQIDEQLSLFTNITGRKLWPQSNRRLTVRTEDGERQDDFGHEQCLVAEEGKKRVLFSGCAHGGVLNILDRFEEIYHCLPDAFVSGFHMAKKAEYTEEETEDIRQTARLLRAMPTRFYTGHCTGERAYALMREILGDKLARMQAGSVFVI